MIIKVDRFLGTLAIGCAIGSAALGVMLLYTATPTQHLAIVCLSAGIFVSFAWQSIK